MGKATTDDYAALRQLAERYADAVNRFDPEAWGETWSPDGEWHVSEVRKGREQVVTFWTDIMNTIENVWMHVHSGVIDDVTGDTARGRWYMGEVTNRGEDARNMNSLCYFDTYRRIDGQWYIQTRKLEALYRGPPDLSGNFSKLPADVLASS